MHRNAHPRPLGIHFHILWYRPKYRPKITTYFVVASPRPSPSPKQPALSSRRFLAERRGLAQCDATIAAACRVKSEGSKWRTARCPPTGGGLCPPMGGQGRTASARTTSANIPPRPSTHLNLGALRCGGVNSGLFRWGDRRTSSARGMIGRTTSASLVSLRGRRAQHEYEPVHTPVPQIAFWLPSSFPLGLPVRRLAVFRAPARILDVLQICAKLSFWGVLDRCFHPVHCL